MIWAIIVLLLLGLLLSAFFSGSETGFYRVTRVRLVLDGRDGDFVSRRLLWLTNNPSVFVATTLVGNNLANYLTSFAIVLASQLWYPSQNAEVLVSILFTPVVFVFGELLPKSTFKDSPNRLIRSIGPLFLVFVLLFAPIALVLWWFAKVLELMVGETPLRVQLTMARQSLQRVLQDGEIAGLLTHEQRDLTRRLFASSNATLNELFRPLPQVNMVDVESTIEELERAAKLTQMATLVVYKSHRKNPVGYISMIQMRLRDQQTIAQYCALPTFPVTCQLTEALVEMRENRLPLAGVTNARNQVIGVVYHDDLIQAIMT
ncbi:MAG: CNNM domain-containing protein [Pirellulales bacterium]|nr:CNNM domain-containing protein [Pirellulales bacterium]